MSPPVQILGGRVPPCPIGIDALDEHVYSSKHGQPADRQTDRYIQMTDIGLQLTSFNYWKMHTPKDIFILQHAVHLS